MHFDLISFSDTYLCINYFCVSYMFYLEISFQSIKHSEIQLCSNKQPDKCFIFNGR